MKWTLRKINNDVQGRHQQETTNTTSARVPRLRDPKKAAVSPRREAGRRSLDVAIRM
jgi:hypothetical protein